MMSDHALEEQAVELDAARAPERLHLRLGRHARHVVMRAAVGAVAGMTASAQGIGRLAAPLAQPGLHEPDLVRLARADSPGGRNERRPVGPLIDQSRHLHRLMVVPDHVLHELHVEGRHPRVRNPRRLLRGQSARRLARRARLHDRRLGQRPAGGGGQCERPARTEHQSDGNFALLEQGPLHMLKRLWPWASTAIRPWGDESMPLRDQLPMPNVYRRAVNWLDPL
jgi:hypothetical protein